MNRSQMPSLGTSTQDTQLARLLDQIIRDFQQNKSPNLEQYASQHPRLADQLADLLPSIQTLVELGGSADARSQTHAGVSTLGEAVFELRGTLGDFQLLSELGRGGMGVVYKAEQISLGRHVALKILPFAAVLGPQQLQRFKNEARAAATLNHPNIVPVHFVGEERGVHFYAMQLIAGLSLADVVGLIGASHSRRDAVDDCNSTKDETEPIASLSTHYSQNPKRYFEYVADLGIQIASALEHAHAHGIVHRDVKPGNILVDEQGKPWITDFGLARIECENDLTMSGDFLGTLRYMSPEQANGKRKLVDERADVYSLGATLFELATLQPVFEGNDRAELLRQVSSEQPPGPRRLHSSIPADLETILLKAIEKDPADRFATAQEFADELSRFVRHEPIQVRRPSLLSRGSKWARRNSTVLLVTTIALSLILVAISVGYYATTREKSKTALALRLANQRLDEAEVITEFLVDLFESPNPNRDGRSVTVAEMLDKAAEKLDSELADQPDRQAKLRAVLGNTYQELGLHRSALPLLQASYAFTRASLGAAHLDSVALRSQLATTCNMCGDLKGALEHQWRVVELLHQQLDKDDPLLMSAREALALFQIDAGQDYAARDLLEELVRCRKESVGQRDPATLKTMEHLAVVYFETDAPNAQRFATDVVALFNDVLGVDDDRSIAARRHLGAYLGPHIGFPGGKRTWEEMLSEQETLLQQTRQRYGLQHPRTIAQMRAVASTYLNVETTRKGC